MAFACGKVLLLGEHAVVYGEPALAAGLEVGVHAQACAGPARLVCPAWGLDVGAGDGSRVGAAFAALTAALGVAGARVELEATVPPGAGLGSSAAMAVATARALAEHAGIALADDALFEAAMASERVFHGTPSGLDHTVAMRGGLTRFVRRAGGAPPLVEPVTVGAPLRLVVAQAAPGADTGAMVAGVAERREHDAEVAAAIEAIGQLTERAIRAVGDGDSDALADAMNENHTLLQRIGVSTSALDAAVVAARAAGAAAAKLTGAGGGGCVVALVDDASAQAVVDALAPTCEFVLDTRVGAP